ncbi:MAG: AraC family transcriptional regulator [Sphingomonas sp.]|uniref:AraC family transcriptional regulator n=1 Tax=Sphingomonas sp. TaxID=28214 RepID=UPI0025CF0C11|nr:AraC family transcriptional regulator [Sphingomonas sp.]MBY0284583.1 AraC family transcriptional regulator [Sphingomonas sp.]
MDVLNDIFETIQLRGIFYYRTDFSGPWATTIPPLARAARFHYVAHGQCWCRVEGAQPLTLETGDFVLIPNGAQHVLADCPTEDAPPLEAVMEAVGYDGEALLSVGTGDPLAATRLVCGHLTFGAGADHPLLRALPTYIHVTDAARQRRPWFNQVLSMLVSNVFSGHPGSIAVVTRLSEVLFIEAIRSAGTEAPQLRAIIDGFSDERIGRAIALIHREPGKHWTVAMLAAEIGMSRTRFAVLFQEMIGVGPISYVIEWRLQKANAQLFTTCKSIPEIARGIGYNNPADFTRAFVQRFGQTPVEFRCKRHE